MNNDIRQRYMKERRRIQRFLRGAKKRGFEFQKDILPNIPKKITEGSIRRLQKLTPKTMYEKAEYVDPYSGQVVSGRKGRLTEIQRAAEKRKKKKPGVKKSTPTTSGPIPTWELSIKYFLEMIEHFPKMAKPFLLNWLNRMIDKFGREIVGKAIEDALSAGYLLTYEIAYSTSELINYSNRLFSFFDVTRTEKRAFEEAMEEGTEEYWRDFDYTGLNNYE